MAGWLLGRCSLLRPSGHEGRAVVCTTIIGLLPSSRLPEAQFGRLRSREWSAQRCHLHPFGRSEGTLQPVEPAMSNLVWPQIMGRQGRDAGQISFYGPRPNQAQMCNASTCAGVAALLRSNPPGRRP